MNATNSPAELPHWCTPKRIAFRFIFTYFLLSIFSPYGLIASLLNGVVPLQDNVGGWWKSTVQWVGQTVFGVTITIMPAGSGDTTFNYVEVFCWAVIAAAVTLLWSVASRRRPSYPWLFEVLRVVVRHYLAVNMILYGAVKVVPLQFGNLSPEALVTPFGERSPHGLLWSFMAASPYYTSFTGVLELIGGLLLLFRRTTLLGALISAGALTHVVVLNFCYDVPVKLFSSHMLAMALFLIAPDAGRLWNFFVRGRPVAPAPLRPRFRRRWLEWSIAIAKNGVFLLMTLGILGVAVYAVHKLGFFGPPKPLHGVWEVDEFVRDGQVLPPLATDTSRWKQVLIMRVADDAWITFRPMTGEDDARKAELAEDTRQLTLKEDQETGKSAIVLAYEEPTPGVLVLSGIVDGKSLRITMHLVPPERFLLVNRGFHWINETPYNR
jgi:hypothetical protein